MAYYNPANDQSLWNAITYRCRAVWTSVRTLGFFFVAVFQAIWTKLIFAIKSLERPIRFIGKVLMAPTKFVRTVCMVPISWLWAFLCGLDWSLRRPRNFIGATIILRVLQMGCCVVEVGMLAWKHNDNLLGKGGYVAPSLKWLFSFAVIGFVFSAVTMLHICFFTNSYRARFLIAYRVIDFAAFVVSLGGVWITANYMHIALGKAGDTSPGRPSEVFMGEDSMLIGKENPTVSTILLAMEISRQALYLVTWALDNVLLVRFNENPYLIPRQGPDIDMNAEKSNATVKLVDLTSDGAATNEEGNITNKADGLEHGKWDGRTPPSLFLL